MKSSIVKFHFTLVLFLGCTGVLLCQISKRNATLTEIVKKFDTKPTNYYYHFITDSNGNLLKKMEAYESVNENHFRIDTEKKILIHSQYEWVSTSPNSKSSQLKKTTQYEIYEDTIEFNEKRGHYQFYANNLDNDMVYMVIIRMGKWYFNEIGFVLEIEEDNGKKLDCRKYYDS